MSTAAELRSLPLRRRLDVRGIKQRWLGVVRWAVKDPASLKYFQLSDEEYFLFEQLDGRSSLEEIRQRFERQFAPRRLAIEQLHGFVSMLHREGLVLGDAPGQGDVLLERARERENRERWSKLASVLAIRFRGIDPQPFLAFLYPATRWMFSWLVTALATMLIFAAIVLVLIRLPEFTAKLPEFEQFFGGSNFIWLGITLASVKILHELGHALMLRHFGGECHEVGPMFLLFTPCLYCNVSDAWMLPSKWQRAAVAAAGIYVELVLAAIATFLWWWSAPGLFNSLCLDVMIVCSLSTLFLNGNPLLRYDGYYVLSDLVEMPNLQEEASGALQSTLAAWYFRFAGTDERLNRPASQRRWLAIYGAASTVYRLFVIAAILWGLHLLLKPYRLDVLVQFAACAFVTGMVVVPTTKVVRFVRNPRWKERLDLRWFAIAGTLSVAALAAILLVPLPSRVIAPLVLRPLDAEIVYVTVPGTLVRSVKVGDEVRVDAVIAQLKNDEITLAAEKARGERDRQRVHVENLHRQAIRSPLASDELPPAEAALADLEKQLAEREADERRLTIVAPAAGTVLPPPRKEAPTEPFSLGEWDGSPLEARNRGAYLTTGTAVCLIGQPEQVEALLLIDQGDVELVRPGQSTALEIDLFPGEHFGGEVVEISPANVADLPRELIPGGEVPNTADGIGRPHPRGTIYQARVKLDDHTQSLLSGATGKARVHVENQSIASRLLRSISATFRVKW